MHNPSNPRGCVYSRRRWINQFVHRRYDGVSLGSGKGDPALIDLLSNPLPKLTGRRSLLSFVLKKQTRNRGRVSPFETPYEIGKLEKLVNLDYILGGGVAR